MPIRNSKVPSDEAFSVHRKARLSGRSAARDRVKPQGANEVDEPETEFRPPEPDDSEGSPEPLAEESRNQQLDSVAEPEGRPGLAGDEPGGGQGERPDIEETAVEPDPGNLPSSPRQHATAQTQEPRKSAATGQIRLQMNLAYPAPGASATFDHLVETQGKKVAFRLVLGKALALYAASVIDGTLGGAATTYPEDPDGAKTSRMFSKAAYDELSRTLNSTGLLSERAMGTTIARRALAAFIVADKGGV